MAIVKQVQFWERNQKCKGMVHFISDQSSHKYIYQCKLSLTTKESTNFDKKRDKKKKKESYKKLFFHVLRSDEQ